MSVIIIITIVFTSDLQGGKRSGKMRIRAQQKIVTERDISQQKSKTSVNMIKNDYI